MEEILEGFLLLACYSDFEDLMFEMEFLSTSQDLLFDIIILLFFFLNLQVPLKTVICFCFYFSF